MNAPAHTATLAERQRDSFAYLWARLDPIGLRLAILAGRADAEDARSDTPSRTQKDAAQDTSVQILANALGLSEAEEAVLLLAVGVQINPDMGESAIALSQGDGVPRVTVSHAMKVLGLPNGPQTFALFSPMGTLFRYGLMQIDGGASFAEAALLVARPTLFFLTSLGYSDTDVAPYLRAAADGGFRFESHAGVCACLKAAQGGRERSAIWLKSQEPGYAEQVFAVSSAPHQALVFDLSALPSDIAAARHIGIRLSVYVAIVGVQIAFEISPHLSPRDKASVGAFFEAFEGHAVFWSAGEGGVSAASDGDVKEAAGGQDIASFACGRPLLIFDVPLPNAQDRGQMWKNALGKALAHDAVDPEELTRLAMALAEDYRIAPHVLAGAALQAHPLDGDEGASGIDGAALRVAASAATRSKLEGLAEHLNISGDLSEVVLTQREHKKLGVIRDHMRNRAQVFRAWKLDEIAGDRGLGVSALFHGSSGTGKTFAAEKLASSLGLELYRVDMSQIVSKWIGDTEKNLRSVFQAARGGGVMLLFDEADAIFTKRAEASDSGGHHANSNVGFLLQAIERHPGMMVLTTNRYDAIDHAFLRRLNYVVDFHAPSHAQRLLIWQKCLPPSVPQDDLDFDLLAGLQLAGGQIRLVAMHAAFRAAARGSAVGPEDIVYAALLEYEKHGRTPSEPLFQHYGTDAS